MIANYRALVEQLLARLATVDFDVALELTRLPSEIRGFGRVKHASFLATEVRRRSRSRACAAPLPP